MVSFKRPFLEREKKVTFLHLGLLVRADGQGRVRNLFWFCLISPGRGGAGSCTRGTPEPSPLPHYVARGARPPDRFQDSAAAETRCDPVACTVFPGLLPPLSLLDLPPPGLPATPAPSSAPTPVFPARILPAGWWPGRSAVGEAAPDRMAMTWDMATVTPAFSSGGPGSHRPRRVCGHHRAGVWVFFCFLFFGFLLILASFSKMGN